MDKKNTSHDQTHVDINTNKVYTLKEISDLSGLDYIGDPIKKIKGVSDINDIKPETLVFLFDEKLKDKVKDKNITLLINRKYKDSFSGNLILSYNPKIDMAKILKFFEIPYEKFLNPQDKSFYKGQNSLIKNNVSIAPFVYIGKNTLIEENTIIMAGAFIGENCSIGKNCIIYPNVSIMNNTVIGNNVNIHSNSVIGCDGYGYVQTSNNEHIKVPQIGNVIIEDDIEIGSNVSIDRATIGSTIIKKGTKIDNAVHIAHNVKIGERTLIVAQSGIAGSTEIGNDVIIAGQSGIAGHLKIGDKTIIMSRSGVTKNQSDNSKISGFPARNHIEDFKEKALIKKIPDLIKQIEELKEMLKTKES